MRPIEGAQLQSQSAPPSAGPAIAGLGSVQGLVCVCRRARRAQQTGPDQLALTKRPARPGRIGPGQIGETRQGWQVVGRAKILIRPRRASVMYGRVLGSIFGKIISLCAICSCSRPKECGNSNLMAAPEEAALVWRQKPPGCRRICRPDLLVALVDVVVVGVASSKRLDCNGVD